MRCPLCESRELMSVGTHKGDGQHWDVICMECGFTSADYPSRPAAIWAFKRSQGVVPGGC